MITISVCLIVKDEEEVIERCLNCVNKFADEIIVVDTGSTDKTKEIAKKYTNKVYDFVWVDDFSKARNFSFSKAKMDYQMWLDADDVILDIDIDKINILKKELQDDIDMVTMKYNIAFDENENPVSFSTRSRLLKKSRNFKWVDPIHEYIPMSGKIMNTDIAVCHKKEIVNNPNRNLKIYEGLEDENHIFTPRQLYYYARELKDHSQFQKSIYYFEKFLSTKEGWIEDNIFACFNLYFCYKSLNEDENAFYSLMRSFNYDSPRAEICTTIGYYYKNNEEYQKAIDWFLISYNLEKKETIGFQYKNYEDYLPCIELCYCYYKINKIQKAIQFNELAKIYRPNSKAVKHNENFFS